MSAKRVNLVSLLALLFLVLVLAITPETRQMMARLAFWMEGVEEKLEASRRERVSAARPAEEESRSAGEEQPEPEQLPPHVVKGADGQLNPEPGYSWINNEPGDHRVEWVPGARHPQFPGVVASNEPDQWRTAPGYDWAEASGVNDMRVVWVPGRRHPDHEHVLAAEKLEEWHPEPGWRWLNDDPNDLRVVPAEDATPPGEPPPPPAATPP